ncbi:MAG: glycosyltransferase family 4 protein [Elusimicrobia bacterium]|nr:glycosyltransferase family 4 protein [Elusimicrobiota bacterium]
MKVLFVSYTSLLQKQYQKRVVELSEYLDDVRVLTPEYWIEHWKKEKVYLEGKLLGDKHITGKPYFTGNLHFAFFSGILKKVIKDFKPDLIDLEDEPFNFGSYQILRAAKYSNKPTKVVLHASQNIFRPYPPPFNFIERKSLKKADLILARTQTARDVLEKKGRDWGVPILPHGIDTTYFKPSDSIVKRDLPALKGADLVIGYVGALTEQKGLNYLIDAFSRIKTSEKLKMLIVGDGPVREKLEEQVREKNLNDKVVFTGAVNHSELTGYYNSMDVFVLPSITLGGQSERFGRVLLEAMSCGVPVIAADSGEIASVVSDAGLLVKEADSEDLREKLERLIEDSSLREEYALRGREHVDANYSWKKLAEKTYALYQKITSYD